MERRKKFWRMGDSVSTMRSTGLDRVGVAAAVLAAWTGAGCVSEYPPPPKTRVEVVTDTIHGIEISDAYRWLEDQQSPEARGWIETQNAYAEEILGDSALREQLRQRFRALMDVPDIGEPRRSGDFEYFTLRPAGRELAVIARRPASEEGQLERIEPSLDYEVMMDPHGMSPDQTTKVDIVSLSKDGVLLLYNVRDGGQDEVEIRVRDLVSGEDRPDVLPNALYGSTFFDANGEGFYYTPRSRETGPRVKYHKLGADFADDAEIFGTDFGPRSFIRTSMVADGKYLVFTVQHGWATSEIHFKKLPDGEVRTLVKDEDARFYPQFIEGELYVRTNLNAPNERILAIDLERPQREAWREVVPEADDVLADFTEIDGRLYLKYLVDVSAQIRSFELDGTPVGGVELPEHVDATIRSASEGKAFLDIVFFTEPRTTYLVDLETGDREVWKSSTADFDASSVVVEQVRFGSRDGTEVPMYLVRNEDVAIDGNAPTLLYGYGGFVSAQMPRFDPMAAVWVEQGGVFAVANLRGGIEFGESWHRDGMLENKQNVFDDFIAAAEWLIENNYTRPERLAIRGASNGGLLVGSALTQRPELFRAVLCGYPDLDMVRFYTFTETNNMPALLEYGDASIAEQFEFLRKYSPYQAVRDGVDYPAVMVTSGDLDTRVSPLQARKMTARLQAASSSGLPVILRYHPKGGHAARRGLPVSENIELQAARVAFLLDQLGLGVRE